MSSSSFQLFNRQSSIVSPKLLLLLLLSLPLVSCSRFGAKDERERIKFLAEIVKREDRRWIGNDSFFELNLQSNRFPEVSQRCAIALGRIGDPKALPMLYSAIHSENAAVRAAAAFAIGRIKERNPNSAPQAIQELRSLLDDSSITVRMRTVEALGKSGSQAEAVEIAHGLERVLSHKDPYTYAYLDAAITALGRLGNPVAVPLLERLTRPNMPGMRGRALDALAQIQSSKASVSSSAKNLQDSRTSWLSVVESYGAYNSSSNIQARLQILNNLRAWTQQKEVQKLLLAGLKDSDRRIRYASHELLREAGVFGIPDAPDPGSGMITDPMAQSLAATRKNSTIAQVMTTRGTIEIELFREDAPVTVQSFVLLAKQGIYNGMELSRINPSRLEGRIPPTRFALGRTVNSEINMRPFERGSIGMALVEANGDSGPYGIFGNEYSDAGGFFITLSPQPRLDGANTCFGRIISGLQIADKLAPGDRIQKIHIKETVHFHNYQKY
jgi:cyclophilin family peptidyl-prolyl cis-trans isomerase/HEAT repeat protein